jgi:hypothetical protein
MPSKRCSKAGIQRLLDGHTAPFLSAVKGAAARSLSDLIGNTPHPGSLPIARRGKNRDHIHVRREFRLLRPDVPGDGQKQDPPETRRIYRPTVLIQNVRFCCRMKIHREVSLLE